VAGLLTEITFGRVAGILTPHALEVGSANWAVRCENTIQLLVVEDCCGKVKLAKRNNLPMIAAVSELQHRGVSGS